MTEPTDRTLTKLWAAIADQEAQDSAEASLRRYADPGWGWVEPFRQPQAALVVARLDAYRRLLDSLAVTEESDTEPGLADQPVRSASPTPAQQLARDVLDLVHAKGLPATADALGNLRALGAGDGALVESWEGRAVVDLLETIAEVCQAHLGGHDGGSAGQAVDRDSGKDGQEATFTAEPHLPADPSPPPVQAFDAEESAEGDESTVDGAS